MAEIIVFSEKPPFKYVDRKAQYSPEVIAAKEAVSTTVYVGKLNCRSQNPTTESQLYTIFSQCGPIKRIIMGIKHDTHEFAGFCFIEFCKRESAIAATKWMNDSFIGGHKIVVNIDYGFEEGRQYLRDKPPRRNFRRDGFNDRRRRPPPGPPPQPY
ncbi:RNA recognition motif domain containing protein [Histomonas meleagridis]|uniref:RNA recognition motif domain containing protein n=1 Tax=Histomonas meleagridis TaxID=135588 RepID=UPI00355A7A4B|nr:RNA recognition motif domain containing protein [Histomonas meleagridis]KAH0806534.1 RNA recognition motif domain containing protein [Histomonas meleagridis]